MKKLLSLLALLITTIGASAQDGWVNPHSDNPGSRTVIYADFSVVGGEEWNAAYQGNWTIGVFVDDECRLSVRDNDADAGVLQSYNNQPFLQLVVPGDYDTENDKGKAITIKVMDGMAAIYTLTPSETLTYDSEKTYGTQPSGPRVQFTLTLPTSITLEEFTCEAGTPVDLMDHVTVVPAEAQLPENVTWFVRDSYWGDPIYDEYATVEGSVMTPIKPYIVEGENKPISYGVVVDGGNYMDLAEKSQFYITQPAQSLRIVTETFETELGYEWELNAFMNNEYMDYSVQNPLTLAYEVTPTDFTEEVKWEYDSEYIEYVFSDQNQAYIYRAIKGGTTRIRPYIERTGGNLYPEGDKWITVTIIVPVNGVEFNWPIEDQTQQYVTFKANVGDDIYERIASRVTVLPADATDKTFQIVNGSDDGADYLTSDNTAKTAIAQRAGTTKVKIQPNGRGGEDFGIEFTVEIFDPLKEVTFTNDPLIIDYWDGMQTGEVRDYISRNILWQTEGGQRLQEGTIAVTGQLQGEGEITPNGPMLNLTNTTIPKGNSTVTVTLGWNDYSNYDGTEASVTTAWNDGQSFTVTIRKSLSSFDVVVTPSTSDPTQGTITLVPVPEDADFDMGNYQLHFYDQGIYSDWNVLTTTPSADNPLLFTYSGTLPGEFYVRVLDEKNEPVYHGEETVTIPAKVSLASGWQWRSNPYGNVLKTANAQLSEMTDLETFFGDNLVEARTYDKLLYNDSEWGYWGSLTEGDPEENPWAIAQAQMYKVKMKAAQEAYLYGGYPGEDVSQTLVPGWNWIGSPYLYDRLLSNALPSGDEGMVIVSKADGSAEWNGQAWEGDLKVLRKGQGYLVYTTLESYLGLVNEVFGGMPQGDETPAGARASKRSFWSYDHTQFASNMTIVAVINEQCTMNNEQWSIGAFVGDECRGEGTIENGRAFITVHTDGGEQVSFRLRNEVTGELFDIDQTVRSGAQRLGSLKAPVQLTSQAVVTGVNNVQCTMNNVQESYDLGGRAVKASTKGLTIRRSSDGKVVKVVK